VFTFSQFFANITAAYFRRTGVFYLFEIITVAQAGDGYEAILIGSPAAKGLGYTPECSVGDLVCSYTAEVAAAIIVRLSNPQLLIAEPRRSGIESAIASMLKKGRQPTMADFLSLTI
jgi:hypothetical protein